MCQGFPVEGWSAPDETQVNADAAARVALVCDTLTTRPELRPEALVAQMKEDVVQAQRALA